MPGRSPARCRQGRASGRGAPRGCPRVVRSAATRARLPCCAPVPCGARLTQWRQDGQGHAIKRRQAARQPAVPRPPPGGQSSRPLRRGGPSCVCEGLSPGRRRPARQPNGEFRRCFARAVQHFDILGIAIDDRGMFSSRRNDCVCRSAARGPDPQSTQAPSVTAEAEISAPRRSTSRKMALIRTFVA